ncbi:MAG: hypothetical protein Fur0018_12570 [Anaerolineales bacterium]
MHLSRKILIPTLLWFTILLAALMVGLGLGITAETRAQESQTLDRLQQAFDIEVETLSQTAIGLANSVASSPDIVQAFAARNRETLLAQTAPIYQRQRLNFPIAEFQFYLPDSSAFLAVHRANGGLEERSVTSTSVVGVAIATQRNASGLEIEEDGLAVRSAVPIYNQDQFIGVLEIALDLNKETLQDMRDELGSDLQILLLNDTLVAARAQGASRFPGPIPALSGYATTLSQPLATPLEATFYTKVLAGTPQTSYIQTLETRQLLRGVPLRDSTNAIIGMLEIIMDRSDAIQTQNQRVVITLGALILAIGLGGLGVTYFTTRTIAPIEILRAAAENIAEGEVEQHITLETNDELGELAQAFNTMSAHISQLMQTLEYRVSERTRDLEKRTAYLQATAEVARTAANQTEIGALLKRVALLIHERFQTYHTSIFLLDSAGEYAILQATAGQSSEETMAARVSLRVGSEGIVGHVAATGQPRIARDIADDPFYQPNPLLPETRTEMVLPLKVSSRILGVLDMQSSDPNAFSSDELQILQILADQIAIAIENLRLLAENQAALEASRRLHGETSRADWRRLLEARVLGYESDASGQYRLETTQITPPTDDGLEIPIRVQDKVIGVIHAEKISAETWLPDEQEILKLLSQQIAYALESARLFNDLQERARREQIITQIVGDMRETLEVDLMLQNLLRDMGENMGFSALQIRLGTPPDHPVEESV